MTTSGGMMVRRARCLERQSKTGSEVISQAEAQQENRLPIRWEVLGFCSLIGLAVGTLS